MSSLNPNLVAGDLSQLPLPTDGSPVYLIGYEADGTPRVVRVPYIGAVANESLGATSKTLMKQTQEIPAGGVNAPLTSTSVAYSATVTPSVSADRNELRVAALTGNVTIAAPTGTARDGQVLTIGLLQDATGGRTVTLDAAYSFGTDVTAAMIPTTANAACEIGFKYHSGSSKWRALAIARGF